MDVAIPGYGCTGRKSDLVDVGSGGRFQQGLLELLATSHLMAWNLVAFLTRDPLALLNLCSNASICL